MNAGDFLLNKFAIFFTEYLHISTVLYKENFYNSINSQKGDTKDLKINRPIRFPSVV